MRMKREEEKGKKKEKKKKKVLKKTVQKRIRSLWCTQPCTKQCKTKMLSTIGHLRKSFCSCSMFLTWHLFPATIFRPVPALALGITSWLPCMVSCVRCLPGSTQLCRSWLQCHSLVFSRRLWHLNVGCCLIRLCSSVCVCLKGEWSLEMSQLSEGTCYGIKGT